MKERAFRDKCLLWFYFGLVWLMVFRFWFYEQSLYPRILMLQKKKLFQIKCITCIIYIFILLDQVLSKREAKGSSSYIKHNIYIQRIYK